MLDTRFAIVKLTVLFFFTGLSSKLFVVPAKIPQETCKLAQSFDMGKLCKHFQKELMA